MKIEHKALLFAIGLAVVIPACTIITEKPADSTPAVSAAPPATVSAPAATASSSAAPTTTIVLVPVATATASASAAPTTASTLPVPGAILKPPKRVTP